jgi:hypothetical protein
MPEEEISTTPQGWEAGDIQPWTGLPSTTNFIYAKLPPALHGLVLSRLLDVSRGLFSQKSPGAVPKD